MACWAMRRCALAVNVSASASYGVDSACARSARTLPRTGSSAGADANRLEPAGAPGGGTRTSIAGSRPSTPLRQTASSSSAVQDTRPRPRPSSHPVCGVDPRAPRSTSCDRHRASSSSGAKPAWLASIATTPRRAAVVPPDRRISRCTSTGCHPASQSRVSCMRRAHSTSAATTPTSHSTRSRTNTFAPPRSPTPRAFVAMCRSWRTWAGSCGAAVSRSMEQVYGPAVTRWPVTHMS